jgi:osmotically inducible protein OsmC
MIISKASAIWTGDLKGGKGVVKLRSRAFEGQYTFVSRFENGQGTNPEELIAAAHASCFSMAFSNTVALKGYHPETVQTEAQVTMANPGDGFRITGIHLVTQAGIRDIDERSFLILAEEAKQNCPVSKVLSTVKITLEARLLP